MIDINKPKPNYIFMLSSIFLLLTTCLYTFYYLKIIEIGKQYFFSIIIYYFFSSIYSFNIFEKLQMKIFKCILIVFFSLLVLLVLNFIGIFIYINKHDLIKINLLTLLILILVIYLTELLMINKRKYNFLLISNEDQKRIIKKLFFEYSSRIKKIIIINDVNFIKHKSNYDDVDYFIMANDIESNIRQKIISLLIEMDKKILIVPGIRDLFLINIKANKLLDTLVFKINDFVFSRWQKVFKRLIDLVFSILAIILFLPLFIIISILIKVFDSGPIFYYQKRLTINQKPFILIKFRTMVVNAERQTGAVFASDNDQRITKIGKILRASRLDELPQIINIIKGDMSVVGPRPEREYFVKQFIKEEPLYVKRFNVKAGITGLSQINVNYNSSYKDKLCFDLLYIYKYSIYSDLKIIFNTLMVMFNPKSTISFEEISLEHLFEKYKLSINIENEFEIKIYNKK